MQCTAATPGPCGPARIHSWNPLWKSLQLLPCSLMLLVSVGGDTNLFVCVLRHLKSTQNWRDPSFFCTSTTGLHQEDWLGQIVPASSISLSDAWTSSSKGGGISGWPRHRENREFDSYFFQTGKTQGILLWHRENFWDTGKIFWLFCYVNVIFLCTFGSPGFKLWGFVGDSLSPIAHKMCVDGFCLGPGKMVHPHQASWKLSGLWGCDQWGEGREWHPLATLVHLHCIEEDPPWWLRDVLGVALYLGGVFPLGTWYHNGSPCPYHPLKITTSAGALVNFFF